MSGALGAEFRTLWAGTAVSNLGDGLRLAALPLLAATLTRDPGATAAVTAAVWLPWLLFGLHGGALVDRLDRPALIRNVQSVRLLAGLALAALVLVGQASMAIVYAAAFLIGVGEVIVESAWQALVPTVVPQDRLERANGNLIAAEMAGNELIGPPFGGLLSAASPGVPFLVDAASFGCSAAVAHRLQRRLPPVPGPRVPLRRITAEVVEGLRWLWGHRYVRAVTVWGGVFNIGSTASYSLLVLLALEVLGSGEVGYGLLLGVNGVGGLVGSVFAPACARRAGRGRTMLVGSVTSGVAVIALGLVNDAFVAGMLLFVTGVSGVAVNVVGRALRQSLVPGRLYGRVASSGRVVVYGGIPLGAALGGWIGRGWGLRTAFIVGGLIMTAASAALAPWLRTSVIDAALEGG